MAPILSPPDGDPALEVYTQSSVVDKLADFSQLTPVQKTDAIIRAQNRVDGRLAGIYPPLAPAVYPALWTQSTTPRRINDITARFAAADLIKTTRPLTRVVATPSGAVDKATIYEDEAKTWLEAVFAGKEELYDPLTNKRLPRVQDWEVIDIVERTALPATLQIRPTENVDLAGWTVVVRVESATAPKGEVTVGGKTNVGIDSEGLWFQQLNEDRVSDKRWRAVTAVDPSKLLGGTGVYITVFAKRHRGRGYGGRAA